MLVPCSTKHCATRRWPCLHARCKAVSLSWKEHVVFVDNCILISRLFHKWGFLLNKITWYDHVLCGSDEGWITQTEFSDSFYPLSCFYSVCSANWLTKLKTWTGMHPCEKLSQFQLQSCIEKHACKSPWWEVNSSKQRCTGPEWSLFAWVPLLRGGKSAFLCLGFSVSLTASPLVVSYGG